MPNPNSTGHATKRGKEKQERKKERSTVFAPERIWRCTWAGVLLRMQNLHFATNDICIAARLANLPLESTSQQTTFVWRLILRYLALKGNGALMKKT